MPERNNTEINTTDREIVSSRVYDAPRERVFKAWTDPNHLMHWWGPKGFTNTFHEFDLKPGGVWRFTMHGPNGANHPNESIFKEIVKPERIVFQHLSTPRFLVTATFEDLGGKTKLVWRMLFESAKERDAVAEKHGAVEGLKQNVDKLEEYLTKI